jgi:hypothetical protein
MVTKFLPERFSSRGVMPAKPQGLAAVDRPQLQAKRDPVHPLAVVLGFAHPNPPAMEGLVDP